MRVLTNGAALPRRIAGHFFREVVECGSPMPLLLLFLRSRICRTIKFHLLTSVATTNNNHVELSYE